jgi:membrane peptidoglycan carboxypeptidase
VTPRSASSLTIVRQRRRRRGNTRRRAERAARRIAFGFGFIVSAAALTLTLAAAFAYASLTRGLPPVEALEAQMAPSFGLLLQPTRLYDRTGQRLLAVLAPTDAPRTFLRYEEFSPWLVKATLALAQPDFWESPGYVLEGWQDPQSHPTLAQELVFRFLLANEPSTPRRALRERLLAAQVTARYGPEQVLEWHLNSTDYGRYAYGAEAAARLYFGKSAADLTLSEAATLAAVGETPALNPFDAPQAAQANWLETLRALLALGWITPAQANEAVNSPPVLLDPPASDLLITDAGVSPQFVDYLLRQLDSALGAGRVERGGAVILTSLDAGLQAEADCALRAQLSRLAGDLSAPPACETAALLPELALSPAQAAGGVLVLDPLTGQILAAAGDLSAQPAGTAITPFLYLTGFARGLNPSSLTWDLPGEAPGLMQAYHGPVRLRIALVNDYLSPARTLLGQLGAQTVRQTAFSFGLDFPAANLLEEEFSISPFHLASAYGVFAVEGLQAGRGAGSPALEPSAVLQVSGADGSLWLDGSAPETRLVVSPQLAYLMNHVLSGRPKGSGLPDIGRPAAVKVSSTLDGAAAWVTGYTPQRVTVVYLTGAGSGSGSAAQGLWQALMQTVVRDLPPADWQMPSGVVSVEVCDPSGLLPTSVCPNVVEEVFLEGRQPLQADTLYQAFEINIETGLLATIFTPPELVRSRVYMLLPPDAQAWAEAAGVEQPPSVYDTYQPADVLEWARITSPAMFSDERGVVEIRGTAAGEEFVSYRLEYGAGLNPARWLQIGGDSAAPVTGGLLARWDTAGLDGLYVLRLLVVRSGGRVDEALVQVTLDNTPPQVAILFPQAGQEIGLDSEPLVALQAQVQEAFLTAVTFYVDGEQVASLSAAPFGVLWPAETGQHVLRVEAADRAGNVGEAEIRFSVKKKHARRGRLFCRARRSGVQLMGMPAGLLRMMSIACRMP